MGGKVRLGALTCWLPCRRRCRCWRARCSLAKANKPISASVAPPTAAALCHGRLLHSPPLQHPPTCKALLHWQVPPAHMHVRACMLAPHP